MAEGDEPESIADAVKAAGRGLMLVAVVSGMAAWPAAATPAAAATTTAAGGGAVGAAGAMESAAVAACLRRHRLPRPPVRTLPTSRPWACFRAWQRAFLSGLSALAERQAFLCSLTGRAFSPHRAYPPVKN
jgi:hypothetical protein